MLRTLSRLQARILIALIAVLAALSLTIGPSESGKTITGSGAYSDVRLYVDIADAVAAGEPYYSAAVRLHRTHGFPTRPFVTVRLPTLAWTEAALGWRTMANLLAALLALTAFAWFWMLRPVSPLRERIAAAVLVAIGGAMAASPELVVTHELWAGVLVALAIALRARGHWVPALLVAALALAIRELALPFALVCAAWALVERRRRELAAWCGLLGAYAVVLWFHRAAVLPLSRDGDALSQGWSGLRGFAAPLRDIADVTVLHLLPAPLSYLVALLAMIGFFGAPPALARLALPYLAGFVVLLAAFARPVNFYWAILTVPMVMAGLAFLPRLASDLRAALRRA